jgi:mlo protein
MEEDFKRVVGISAFLWAIVCIFLLTDLNGWYTYFWIAFIPTILVLIVGAKLQHIIISLAIEVRGGVDKITITDPDQLDDGFKKAEKPKLAALDEPTKPRDDLFWFKRPHVLVKLIHFILFQNAFELAFFFWAMFTYGFDSCLVGKRWMILVRLGMGVFVQILCSASTLPLYALVSQMGSSIKFDPDWRERADKANKGNQKHNGKAHHLAGILGVDKEVNRKDRAVDIELPVHHGANNMHEYQHPYPPYPHPDQAGSNAMEIDEAPMPILPKSADPRNNPSSERETNSEKLSLANVFKLAAEKEKLKKSSSKQKDDIP